MSGGEGISTESCHNIDEPTTEPSPESFFEEYVQGNKPVLLRGHSAVKTWPGLNWSVEYLKQWEDELIRVAPLQVDD